MPKELNDKELIAKALLEWTKNSKTTFITASDELKEIAATRGLDLPSPDLAVFKTVYAELEKPNRNRVRLPRKAVEEGMPSIVGKQINFDHKGSNFICGYMLDGKIEGNNIVIYGAFFKSMFRDEFQEVKEKFEKSQLFVSFEIHRYDKEGELVIEALNDGTYKMNKIHFAGCGLLLEEDPACPKAQVLMLLASNKALDSDISEIADNEILREDLVYAELLKEEDMGKINEKTEDIKEDVVEEVKEEIKGDIKEETKEEATENEKGEENKEEAKTIVTTVEDIETVRTMDSDENGGSETVEVKGEVKQEVVYDDGIKETTVEEIDNKVTYTYKYVQDMQVAHKKEIKELKASHTIAIQEAKVHAEKVTARRISLGDSSKDIAEDVLADDVKFENLQLKRKVQELESASVEDKKEEKADLVVGDNDSVEAAKTETPYGTLRQAIDTLCWETK